MGFEDFLGVNPWTALFTLANTVALFLVAKRYLFGPIMNMIYQRQQEIDSLYADAGTAKEQALAMEAEYQQKLADASQTGEQIVREAVLRGQAREEEILLQANREANAIRTKAQADIALEKKKAINDAKDAISGMAVAIAEKVVCRELTAADQTRLVEDFIDELGETL